MAVAVCTMAVGVVDQAFWRSNGVDDASDLLTVYNRRAAAPQFQTLSYPDYVAGSGFAPVPGSGFRVRSDTRGSAG
jgi:hypothetical protein